MYQYVFDKIAGLKGKPQKEKIEVLYSLQVEMEERGIDSSLISDVIMDNINKAKRELDDL